MLRKNQIWLAGAVAGALLLRGWGVFPHSSVHSLPSSQQADGNEPSQAMKRALELLYDQQQPRKSLVWLERELADHPDNAQAHAEYANALYMLGDYAGAVGRYEQALTYSSSQQASIYFGISRCKARLGGVDWGEYLMQATEAGFGDYRQVLTDAAFKYVQDNQEFIAVFTEAFHYDGKAMGEAFWHFAPKREAAGYALSVADLYGNDTKEGEQLKISSDFSELVPGVAEVRFSRKTNTNNFSYELAYQHTKNYYAVIYKEEVRWSDEPVNPQYYYLVTYSPEGALIDMIELAHRTSATARTVDMQGDKITIQNMLVTSDIDKKQMPMVQPNGTALHYRLSAEGKIQAAG